MISSFLLKFLLRPYCNFRKHYCALVLNRVWKRYFLKLYPSKFHVLEFHHSFVLFSVHEMLWMANPHWSETSVPKYLPERFAQIYYAHGLFCSSHPTLVIILTTVIVLLCSYPLLNLPLPGNTPQTFSTHDSQENVTAPRWFHNSPKLFVQQVRFSFDF